MANQGYAYDDLRDLFYLSTGGQSQEDSVLEGEMTTGDAVTALIAGAERWAAAALFDPYMAGKAPFMAVMVIEKGFSQVSGGAVTQWQLPPTDSDSNIFYKPISAHINSSDASTGYSSALSHCPIKFMPKEFETMVFRDSFSYPQTGSNVYDFVPSYFEGGYWKFWRAPWGTQSVGQNNLFLTYYRLPKVPSGTYSDMPLLTKEMVCFRMCMDYWSIDGAQVDLALSDTKKQHAASLYAAAVSRLGFNPFTEVKNG
jgi:hypothetical protein